MTNWAHSLSHETCFPRLHFIATSARQRSKARCDLTKQRRHLTDPHNPPPDQINMLAVWCQITLDWLSDVRLGITVGKIACRGDDWLWRFTDYDYAVWAFTHVSLVSVCRVRSLLVCVCWQTKYDDWQFLLQRLRCWLTSYLNVWIVDLCFFNSLTC